MRLLAVVIFLLATIDSAGQRNFTWRDAQKSKKGIITIYWFPNEPFGFEETDGSLTGIEVEIMRLFQQYLKSKHGVQVDINWVPQQTFKQVLDHMRYDSLSGVFGVAGFSFTEERKTYMKFSPSYMADMAVLVSTSDIPVVRNKQDLVKSFKGATALTAQGTILEKELIALRDENNLDFQIEYTGGSALLIDLLQTRKKSFGYLNLPVYLMGINNGITTLHRHNYLTKRYEALADYAFITAHKLRAPLSSILGLVNLMHRVNLPNEEKILVTHLMAASEKLDAIVHEVMKSVEAPRDTNEKINGEKL